MILLVDVGLVFGAVQELGKASGSLLVQLLRPHLLLSLDLDHLRSLVAFVVRLRFTLETESTLGDNLAIAFIFYAIDNVLEHTLLLGYSSFYLAYIFFILLFCWILLQLSLKLAHLLIFHLLQAMVRVIEVVL